MRVEHVIHGRKLVGTSGPRYSADEMKRRFDIIFAGIKDRFGPESDRKILAVDVESGEFEIAAESTDAVNALFARIDDPQIYCTRLGNDPAVYRALGVRFVREHD